MYFYLFTNTFIQSDLLLRYSTNTLKLGTTMALWQYWASTAQVMTESCLILCVAVDESSILDCQFSDFYHSPPQGFEKILFEQQIFWAFCFTCSGREAVLRALWKVMRVERCCAALSYCLCLLCCCCHSPQETSQLFVLYVRRNLKPSQRVHTQSAIHMNVKLSWVSVFIYFLI